MSLALIIVTALAVLWFAERSVEHLTLVVAALCFSTAVLLFVVTDLERAILLSSILAAAIFSASRVKYNHSGIKLIVTDLPLAFAGTVPFLLAQYPLALTAALAGSIALMLAAAGTVFYVRGQPVSLELQVLFFGIACISLVAAYRASGGPVTFQRNGSPPVFSFELHRLPSQPTFLAAVRRADSERYSQRSAAADGGRTGAQLRLS